MPFTSTDMGPPLVLVPLERAGQTLAELPERHAVTRALVLEGQVVRAHCTPVEPETTARHAGLLRCAQPHDGVGALRGAAQPSRHEAREAGQLSLQPTGIYPAGMHGVSDDV